MAILVRARLLPPFPRSFCALSVSISEMHLIDEQHRERRLQPEPPSPLPKWERRGGRTDSDRSQNGPRQPKHVLHHACVVPLAKEEQEAAAPLASVPPPRSRRGEKTAQGQGGRRKEGHLTNLATNVGKALSCHFGEEEGEVLQKSAPPRQTADSGGLAWEIKWLLVSAIWSV